MRRCNVVSGILLILPIIDFALAAPVPVQEKGRACVDVVHRPEDVITVLGKRLGGEELEKAAEEYLNPWGHASSNSAPSEPDHGLTNIGQVPAPNSASSTANPDHALVEPSSPSPAVSPVHAPLPAPASSQVGLIHGSTEAHTPKLDPKPMPSTGENFDWDYWMNVKDPPPLPKPAPLKASSPVPSTDDNSDRNYWTNVKDPPPSTAPIFNWNKLKKSKDSPLLGPASSQSSNPKPSTGSTFSWNKLKNLKDQISPGPVSSQPLDQKPSTGSTFNWNKLKNLKGSLSPGPASTGTKQTFNWKNLVNLKDQPAPGPASKLSQLGPLDQKPASTGSTFNWKKLVNLKEPPPLGPASLEPSSSSSNPKPSTNFKSGLLKFTDNLLDKLSLLDPLPRPKPTTSAPPEYWYWQKLSDAGPSNSKPSDTPINSISAPLKFKEPKTETTERPDVDAVNESPSSSTGSQRVGDEAAAYAAKGKAIDPGGVSFFLVPHSSAYPKIYIPIDIF